MWKFSTEYLINLSSGKLKNDLTSSTFLLHQSAIFPFGRRAEINHAQLPPAQQCYPISSCCVCVCVTVFALTWLLREYVPELVEVASAFQPCKWIWNMAIMRLSVMNHHLVNVFRRNLCNNVIFNSEFMWLNRLELYNFYPHNSSSPLLKSPVLSFNSRKFNSVLFLDHHLH